jgi:hypothetical protein
MSLRDELQQLIRLQVAGSKFGHEAVMGAVTGDKAWGSSQAVVDVLTSSEAPPKGATPSDKIAGHYAQARIRLSAVEQTLKARRTHSYRILGSKTP